MSFYGPETEFFNEWWLLGGATVTFVQIVPLQWKPVLWLHHWGFIEGGRYSTPSPYVFV